MIENEIIGAAFGRFEHRILANDALFRSHWALKCKFKMGKIASHRLYEDTAALEEAMNSRSISRETIV